MNSVQQDIVDVVNNLWEVEESVTVETNLMAELGADRDDILDICLELRKRRSYPLPQSEQITTWCTVGQIVDFYLSQSI